jgi:uncharacterized protein YndB with AHSA1/START domain
MGIEVVIAVNASAERVWAALMDVEAWPRWTSSMTSVTRTDNGDFGIGSQARIKQPGIGPMTWTVTALTPVQSFVWEAKRPGLTLVAGHYLTAGDGGTVNLALKVEQKGLVGRLLEPLTKNPALRAVHLEAEGHKRRAETAD